MLFPTSTLKLFTTPVEKDSNPSFWAESRIIEIIHGTVQVEPGAAVLAWGSRCSQSRKSRRLKRSPSRKEVAVTWQRKAWISGIPPTTMLPLESRKQPITLFTRGPSRTIGRWTRWSRLQGNSQGRSSLTTGHTSIDRIQNLATDSHTAHPFHLWSFIAWWTRPRCLKK